MKFACPHCGQHIEVEDELAGREANCPACNRDVTISSPPRNRVVASKSGLLIPLVLAVALEAVIILNFLYYAVPMFRHMDCVVVGWALWSWMIFIYGQAAAWTILRALGGSKKGLFAFAGVLCVLLCGLGLLNRPMSGRLALRIPDVFEAAQTLSLPAALLLLLAGFHSRQVSEPYDHRLSEKVRYSSDPFVTLRLFRILVLISMVLSALISVVLIPFLIMALAAGEIVSAVLAITYLAGSVIALVLSLIQARRAHRESDVDRLWRAGLLALIGGLQHAVLIGMPAIFAGIMVLHRASRGRSRELTKNG